MAGDAVAKKHSTTSEAIGVGLAMEARRVILTHFSQRYQKIPVMDGVHQQEVGFEDDESSGISDSSVVRDGKIADRPPHDGMKVAVAFDYMRIKVKDIALMERFRPVLLKLYETASVLDDEVGRPPTDETQPGRDLRQAKPKQKQKPQTQQRHVAKATRPTA
jgi:ribonuclease Z